MLGILEVIEGKHSFYMPNWIHIEISNGDDDHIEIKNDDVESDSDDDCDKAFHLHAKYKKKIKRKESRIIKN